MRRHPDEDVAIWCLAAWYVTEGTEAKRGRCIAPDHGAGGDRIVYTHLRAGPNQRWRQQRHDPVTSQEAAALRARPGAGRGRRPRPRPRVPPAAPTVGAARAL